MHTGRVCMGLQGEDGGVGNEGGGADYGFSWIQILFGNRITSVISRGCFCNFKRRLQRSYPGLHYDCTPWQLQWKKDNS